MPRRTVHVVITILKMMFLELEKHDLGRLPKTVSPITRFDFGPLSVLRMAKSWGALVRCFTRGRTLPTGSPVSLRYK